MADITVTVKRQKKKAQERGKRRERRNPLPVTTGCAEKNLYIKELETGEANGGFRRGCCSKIAGKRPENKTKGTR